MHNRQRIEINNMLKKVSSLDEKYKELLDNEEGMPIRVFVSQEVLLTTEFLEYKEKFEDIINDADDALFVNEILQLFGSGKEHYTSKLKEFVAGEFSRITDGKQDLTFGSDYYGSPVFK